MSTGALVLCLLGSHALVILLAWLITRSSYANRARQLREKYKQADEAATKWLEAEKARREDELERRLGDAREKVAALRAAATKKVGFTWAHVQDIEKALDELIEREKKRNVKQ